ncbi:hypothetical protein BHE74_00045597 [Ensete ventricosum]|nr:hypothetical protein BHE74_00045597 [Ensete ventricosum]
MTVRPTRTCNSPSKRLLYPQTMKSNRGSSENSSRLGYPAEVRSRAAQPRSHRPSGSPCPNRLWFGSRLPYESADRHVRQTGAPRAPDDGDAMMVEKREDEMEASAAAIPPRFSSQIPSTFPLPGGFFDADGGDKGSIGFLELLGLRDLHQPPFLFELPPPTSAVEPPPATSDPPSRLPPPAESSDAANFPATPSSISSSSTEAAVNAIKPAASSITNGDEGEQANTNRTSKEEEKKKKGQKRQREPRFAFKTRSEVDHLEDGYRWRKYGQKAVKNSPYPSVSCGVKKRVERSSEDPEVVVTTYEGQHTHPSPVLARGAHLPLPPPPLVLSERPPPPLGFGFPSSVRSKDGHIPLLGSYLPPSPLDFRPMTAPQPLMLTSDPTTAVAISGDPRHGCNRTAEVSIRDHGLLQDLIPSKIRKEEEL